MHFQAQRGGKEEWQARAELEAEMGKGGELGRGRRGEMKDEGCSGDKRAVEGGGKVVSGPQEEAGWGKVGKEWGPWSCLKRTRGRGLGALALLSPL